MSATAMIQRTRIDSIRKPEGITITDELRAQFPAVFADAPSPKMSDAYQFYPSYRLIEDMDRFDMKLVQIGQQTSIKRDPSHQLHVLRFQPKGNSAMPTQRVGDAQMELVILNSHNGRNRFQAHAGVFRLVCLNGMVVADRSLGSIDIKHVGADKSYDTVKQLIDGMAQRVGTIGSKIDTWAGITLSWAQQMEIARAVMEVRRFPDWLDADQLLVARREQEDVDAEGRRSLWTTFNVLQENVIKGGIDKTGAGRPSATRPITGAFNDVAVNKALWSVIEDYYERLDGGAPTTPVDEPEVQAKRDEAGEESKEDRRRRLDRERKAAKRAAAREAKA